ncbi:receptor for egg jelly 2 protein precursor [Strongylocentrotus purpuratus]|uniref:Sperm membrane protein n=1 Tax=Strongylocentrotus purpuratus TaxID=7668 RepID=Q6V9R4_STRPU|nr:receptor for egg jelly 2 protein precursor [Strongylocentrotus purpuratus]AAQ56010.1 sperm membrane protein [Strongylocentrotus purpuratus]|eukprot:NP_999802.1 receptor for egg jelly 2 protein precursor [Strongylocentrotus purpuratus]
MPAIRPSTVYILFLFIAILKFRTARLEEYGCPIEWVHEPASGYCYLAAKRYLPWQEARDYCLGVGAELLSIHSAEENAFIHSIILNFVWMGLHDQDTEGVLTTFTDGSPVGYTNWDEQNWQTANRDCVYMKHHNGYWFLKECSHDFRFVCEKVHELITTTIPATNTFPATIIINLTTVATSIATTIPATAATSIATTIPATAATSIATTIPATAATSIATTIPATAATSIATTIPATAATSIATTIPATAATSIATTIPATAATSIATTIPATASTNEAVILIELLLIPNNVSSIDNIFRVNDTILVNATVSGSFQPLSSQILWSITNHLSGDSVQYTVYSEDAVLVRFTTGSVFTVEATAVGNSYNLTATANATVLPATTRILCPNHVYTSREVWCALLADSAVKHSNYTFCFTSSLDSCFIANPRPWSLDDLPDAMIGRASSMDGYLASFLNHAYSIIGTYEMTSTLFHTLTTQVNVTVKHSCIISLTTSVKEHCDAPRPAVHLGTFNIHISAHMELNEKCIDPMTSHFEWWIFTSTVDDDVVTAFEKITHTSQVTIPSGTVPCGVYSLNVKAQTHLKSSGEVTGEEQIFTRLEIQPSPLVAVIKGGASRSHGVSSNLTVDGSTSYDPDVPLGSSSNLTFMWYCVVVSPDIMYSSLDEAIQNTDDACFEDEGIMMNSTSSMIEVIANKLNADVTMNFWLNISKEGRISVVTQQRVHLTPGLVPEIEISCISNCNMYISTAERLVLHASCTNCDGENEDVVFQWSLESDHTSAVGDLSSQTTTGIDQPYLAIKPHTFDSIPETGSIILRATGYQSDSDGYAEFNVHFNAPPSLGCCLVTPDEGYALQTDFTVTCFGFTNVDEPLTYQIILFSRVDVVDGIFVGRGEGFELYEGSESIRDGLYLPAGVGTDLHTVSIQVNVKECNTAKTSVYKSARVYPLSMDAVGMNVTQELLDMTLYVESNVNSLLAVGDTAQAAQLISALGSILNSIGEEGETQEGRETRSEIRSSLVTSVAAIPVESMTYLRQSSAAFAVITHNKQEISPNVQMLAASTLSVMTSFLKSKSGTYKQAQENIESAGTILVEGLSNILSAAKETESLLSNNITQQAEDHKNLIEVTVSAVNDIQDAIVAGKIPSEAATVITSPALSIAVGSISRDELAEATFGGSEEDLGSFRMPSDDVLNQTMAHVNGTTVSMKMSAMKWNPFSWLGAGGESVKSSIVGIQLKADHILEFHDLSADIDVYIPMRETLSADPVLVHITENSSSSIVIDHSSMPDEGALHLTVISETEPMVALSICSARISVSESSCVGDDTTLGVSDEVPDTDANFTWTVPLVDLKAADGIMIRLYDREDQPCYQDDNITLSVFMHTLQCNFWNEDQQEWDSTGCKVGPLSKPSTTHCLCNHLNGFFGSSILVPPNQVLLNNDAHPVISDHQQAGLVYLIYGLIGYVLYCIVLFVCVIGCLFIIRIYRAS